MSADQRVLALCVPASLAISEAPPTADQSAYSLLNVSSVRLASSRSVLTPVPGPVEPMPSAKWSTTTPFAAVPRDTAETRSSTAIKIQRL